jgi:hypothetical protein
MLSLMALSGTETGPVASTLGLRPAVDVTEPCAERSTARRGDTRIHRSFLALYALQNRAKLHTARRFGRDDQADASSLKSREKSKTPRSASSENRLELAEGDIAVRTVTRPRLMLFLRAPESHQRCRDRCRGGRLHGPVHDSGRLGYRSVSPDHGIAAFPFKHRLHLRSTGPDRGRIGTRADASAANNHCL